MAEMFYEYVTLCPGCHCRILVKGVVDGLEYGAA